MTADQGPNTAAMPSTYQEHLQHLGQDPAASEGDRGVRFCWHHLNNKRDGTTYTWSEIAGHMHALAAQLREQDLALGDVVVIHVRDQHRAFVSMLACMYLGLVPTAVAEIGKGSPQRLVEQFHRIVGAASPKLLITDKTIDEQCLNDWPALPPVLEFTEIQSADAPPVLGQLKPDDACFLQFTSGSTSTPKGVVVRQSMVLANCDTMAKGIGYSDDERYCAWLPIYHDMGLLGYLRTCFYQNRTCFFPTSRFGRSPNMWMELMSEEKSNVTAGPNTAFEMVNRYCERRAPNPEEVDLSAATSIVCGSEPISANVMRRFNAFYEPCKLKNGVLPAFGMAESTLMSTCHPLGDPIRSIVCDRQKLQEESKVVLVDADHPQSCELVACGPAAYGINIRIEAQDRSSTDALPEDTVGELLLSGDSILSEYYQRPDATEAAIDNRDGTLWFHTGDIAFMHNGEVYICGRAADLIIHNGVNYHPSDIERELQEAFEDRVRGACVLDMRANIADEFIGLGVYMERANKTVDAEALMQEAEAWCKTYTGLPIAICLASGDERIPRTTSGKVVRRAVKELLAAHL